MQVTSILLIGMIVLLIHAFTQTPNRTRPAWSQHLHGWQKLFGIVAVILAFLIMINPEFLALGLLGDAAFFEALVLALALQLHMTVVRAWHRIRPLFSKTRSFMLWRLNRTCAFIALEVHRIGSLVSKIRAALITKAQCV